MKIHPDVLNALDGAHTDGPLLRLPDLERSLYVQVDKALRATGGRWDGSRHVRAHRFDRPADQILRLLRTGEIVTAREKGYVPTPPEIGAALVAHLDVGPGDRVLEPSAGDGALIQALAVTRATVDAVELDRDHEAALTRLQIDGMAQSITWADFLSLTPPDPQALFDLSDRGLYDAVAMNPPFAHQSKHLLHALNWIKPGGQLAAIASASLTFHNDAASRELRARLEEYGAHIQPLPKDAFVASGVGVRTVLIGVTTPDK